MALQLFEILNDFREGLAHVSRCHDREGLGLKRLEKFLDIVEKVIDVVLEPNVKDTALAIALDLQRLRVGTAGKNERTGHDDENARPRFRLG